MISRWMADMSSRRRTGRECDPVPPTRKITERISAPLQEMSGTIFSKANCKKSLPEIRYMPINALITKAPTWSQKAYSAEVDEPKADSQTAMRQTRNTNKATPKTARLLFERDQHHSLQLFIKTGRAHHNQRPRSMSLLRCKDGVNMAAYNRL